MSSRLYFDHFQKVLADLASDPDRGVKFWFADVTEFECSACGQCCRMDWMIHVSREYYEAWEKELGPKLGLRTEEVFQLIPQGSREQYAYLRKQPNSNRCVLLNERELCLAHAALGSEAKPDVCQSYPHATTRLPWLQYGTSYLSASCHKVGREQPQDLPLRHKFYALPAGTPLPRMSVTGRHQLSLGGLYLWTSLQLDLLDRSPGFGAWLANVTDCITQMMRMAESELGQTELAAVTWPPSPPTPMTLQPAEQAQILRSLMQPMSTRPIIAGWIPVFEAWAQGQGPQPLSAEENALLWRYQRYYWQRQVLGQDWLLGGRLDLLHQQVFWALTGLLIRLGALLYRQLEGGPLNAEQIGKATNVVQAYVLQNHSAPQLLKIDGLRPEACLVLLSRLSLWPEA